MALRRPSRSCATGVYTGATDTDPVDAIGYGRTGVTDADPTDAVGRGRAYSGVTDSDSGAYADLAGRGRRGRLANRNGPASGSGFFISTEGHIVTNFHVVRDRGDVTVTYNGQDLPAQLLASDPANDIAILKIETTSMPLPIGSARDVRVGEEIIALGFPLAQIQGQEMRASFGRINALSSINSDVRHLQIDAPVQPGNSGGPLIGPDGHVVGVVTARLDDLATLRATGALPENVSFSLRIDYLAPILPAGVVLSQTPLTGSTADRVAAARSSVVFIMAQPAQVSAGAPSEKPPPASQTPPPAPPSPTQAPSEETPPTAQN